MAMATRNTLTSVRHISIGKFHFAQKNIWVFSRKFGESLAKAWRKKAIPRKLGPELWTCYV